MDEYTRTQGSSSSSGGPGKMNSIVQMICIQVTLHAMAANTQCGISGVQPTSRMGTLIVYSGPNRKKKKKLTVTSMVCMVGAGPNEGALVSNGLSYNSSVGKFFETAHIRMTQVDS